jgi:hypothetical protein
VNRTGFEILALSVKRFKAAYQDKFDYVISHNNLSTLQLKFVKDIGVELHTQTAPNLPFIPPKTTDKDSKERNLHGVGTIWRLCPPRLKKDVHEIVLDNDVIIHDQMEEIDEFLASNKQFLITESHPWGSADYGNYTDLIPVGLRFNCGVFGMPPGFDMEDAISKVINKVDHHADVQGILASILGDQPFVQIPHTRVHYHWEDYFPVKHKGSTPAPIDHFLSCNRAIRDSWPQYLKWAKENPELDLPRSKNIASSPFID